MARQKQEQALAIRTQHGLKGFAAESQAALAAIDIEEQQWTQAEGRARAAAEQFERDSQGDNLAFAQALLAQALVGQNRLAEAAQVMARAQEAAAKHQSRVIRLYVQRNAVLLRLKQDKGYGVEAASRELAALLAEARAAGLEVEEFELRMAQYSLLLARDRGPERLNQVRSFAQEAASRGFELVVRRAAASLSAPQ